MPSIHPKLALLPVKLWWLWWLTESRNHFPIQSREPPADFPFSYPPKASQYSVLSILPPKYHSKSSSPFHLRCHLLGLSHQKPRSWATHLLPVLTASCLQSTPHTATRLIKVEPDHITCLLKPSNSPPPLLRESSKSLTCPTNPAELSFPTSF